MRREPLAFDVALSLEPLATADAHAYWRVFASGRTDLPTRDLKVHMDRYLALPPSEQRTHFAIRKEGRIIGTVRLNPPGEISGFSIDPAHTIDASAAVLRCVDFLRAAGAVAITGQFEDRYAAAFESLGFRRIFARMRMEASTRRAPLPEGLHLVPPEEGEVAGLTAFLMDVYDGHVEQQYGLHSGSDEEWRGYVTGLLKGDSGRFMPDASFVALDGKQVVGAILTTHWMGMPLVAELGVTKDYRGRGVGRALLQAAMNRLEGLGEPRLSLYVTVGNDPAVRLYASMGFERVGGPSVTARLEA